VRALEKSTRTLVAMLRYACDRLQGVSRRAAQVSGGVLPDGGTSAHGHNYTGAVAVDGMLPDGAKSGHDHNFTGAVAAGGARRADSGGGRPSGSVVVAAALRIDRGGNPGGCGFWLATKDRYCRTQLSNAQLQLAMVDAVGGEVSSSTYDGGGEGGVGNCQFCAQHQPVNGTRPAKDARAPCPLDPSHTVFARNLKKHLRKCNVAKAALLPTAPPPPHIRKGVNTQNPNVTVAAGQGGASGGTTLPSAPPTPPAPLAPLPSFKSLSTEALGLLVGRIRAAAAKVAAVTAAPMIVHDHPAVRAEIQKCAGHGQAPLR
jgi:hypothetical protein